LPYGENLYPVQNRLGREGYIKKVVDTPHF
jgi:hypothetical protein